MPGLKLVGVYQRRGDWTNAKTLAVELAAQFPGNADILDTQGQAQLAAGDTNSAVSSFKRAYALAPNSAPILSRYLNALNGAKFLIQVRGVLQDAIARDPKNSSLKADLIRVEGEITHPARPRMTHQVRDDVGVEQPAHPLDVDRLGRRVVDLREFFLELVQRIEQRQQRARQRRLDDQPRAILLHDRVATRQFELTRDPHRLVLSVAEQLHIAPLHCRPHMGSAYA